ncbi:MAG: hypothetical protein IMW89_21700 [Ktedonobacteraceae bacterium]|nr:hypothetical protein [Ktedonobacteraceae bacterium]
MNMLIIGGLIAAGLLALVGVVALSSGEKSAASPARNAAQKTAKQSKATTTPLPAVDTAEQRLPARREEESLPFMFNGQMRELAAELRALHQQALELGQRLNVLTEIADHIEQRAQATHISVTEDEHPER